MGVSEDGLLGVVGLDTGFFGADGLGLGAGLAVVRGGSGTWGFSTSFMSSVSERWESKDRQTLTGFRLAVHVGIFEWKAQASAHLCSTGYFYTLLRSLAGTGNTGGHAGTEPRQSSCPCMSEQWTAWVRWKFLISRASLGSRPCNYCSALYHSSLFPQTNTKKKKKKPSSLSLR